MLKQLILFSTFLVFLCACSFSVQPYAIYSVDEEKLAQQRIAEIRADWNAKLFNKLVLEGGSKFSAESQRALIIARMKQAFVEYGTFKKVTDSKFRVLMVSPLQVRAAFHSKFEKVNVSERVTLIKIDGVYKLDGYIIEAQNIDLDKLLGNDY